MNIKDFFRLILWREFFKITVVSKFMNNQTWTSDKTLFLISLPSWAHHVTNIGLSAVFPCCQAQSDDAMLLPRCVVSLTSLCPTWGGEEEEEEERQRLFTPAPTPARVASGGDMKQWNNETMHWAKFAILSTCAFHSMLLPINQSLAAACFTSFCQVLTANILALSFCTGILN